MKKLSIILALVAIFTFGMNVQAQEEMESVEPVAEEVVDSAAEVTEAAEVPAEEMPAEEAPEEEASGHKILLEKFIEGGAGFMSLVLV